MRGSKLGLKLLAAMASVLLVAACSNDPYDSSVTDDASGKSTMPSGIGASGVDTSGMNGSGTGDELAAGVGDRVFFATDSTSLTSEGQDTLRRQAQWLAGKAGSTVTIEGHADERGTREYNLALGERRAAAARNFLIANGVDASRITTISYGKERPAVEGHDESAWSQNRRAVTVVQ